MACVISLFRMSWISVLCFEPIHFSKSHMMSLVGWVTKVLILSCQQVLSLANFDETSLHVGKGHMAQGRETNGPAAGRTESQLQRKQVREKPFPSPGGHLDCSHVKDLKKGIQLFYAQIPNPPTVGTINVCYLKLLNLGVVCYAAVDN